MKKIISILLTLTMLGSVTAFAAEEITLTINNVAIPCDVAPQVVNDRVLAPLRVTAEHLGAGVLWDGETATVHMQTRDGSVISMQIGSDKLFTADGVKTMEVAPMIIGDRTMVPLRAIAECLGCEVSWNEDAKAVEIVESDVTVDTFDAAEK